MVRDFLSRLVLQQILGGGPLPPLLTGVFLLQRAGAGIQTKAGDLGVTT